METHRERRIMCRNGILNAGQDRLIQRGNNGKATGLWSWKLFYCFGGDPCSSDRRLLVNMVAETILTETWRRLVFRGLGVGMFATAFGMLLKLRERRMGVAN